jgi:hypothetical protein
LALFDGHGDIGPVARPGTVAEDPAAGALVIEGAGANMWFGSDEGHFLWKKMTGDFIVSARAEFLGEGVEAHRKIGWMVRDPWNESPASVVVGDGLTSLHTENAERHRRSRSPSRRGADQLERRG